MTGYGSAESITDAYSLKVEIKSLNSKFLDLSLKIPKEFGSKELELKTAISNQLNRGKINFNLDFQPIKFTDSPIEINRELFSLYFNQFQALAQEAGTNNDEAFRLALHSPNVIMPKEDFSDLITWDEVTAVVTDALSACNTFRSDEGQQLERSMKNNISQIAEGLVQITDLDPQRVANVRNRIEQGLQDIRDKTQIDKNRFEQELIYYLEKLDISEEKVRLKSHLDYFILILDSDESNGKKLGFIAQEIGREVNTIGSKANDAAIQRIVVKMKDELEQIKEQVLNVM